MASAMELRFWDGYVWPGLISAADRGDHGAVLGASPI